MQRISGSVLLALFIGITFFNSAPSHGQDVYIPVGEARTRKSVVAFPEIRISTPSATATEAAHEISTTLKSDLIFMDMFKFMEKSAFLEDEKVAGIAPNTFQISDWKSIGVEFLIKTGLSIQEGQLTLEAYLYDITGAKQIFGKRYNAKPSDATTVGHTLGNDFMEALTGRPGIFLSKIATVCDRTGHKEVYIMDFDGKNVKQITRHRSVTVGPAWSPDGNRLAYSLYLKRGNNSTNLDLYEYDFKNKSLRMLSNRRGINSGAAYHPIRNTIAATMSFKGNPEIFSLDPADRTATRLTKSFGYDVDPEWSPDGKYLAFVSSRSGPPMIFRMDTDGSNVKRLTYAGKYNATPSWSPLGDKIAFAGHIDGVFDIFTMNADGTKMERLTKQSGSNEDPDYSPDGNLIVFSSNRAKQKNIYVMNADGTFVRRMTYGLGNCVSPKWSTNPKL